MVEVDVVEVVLLGGKDGHDLVAYVKRGVTTLLEQLHHVRTVVELVLRGGVEVRAELGEGLLLAIAREVEPQRTRLLLHGLDLRVTADAGHGDAHVDRWALALEEEVRLQIDLAVGDGDHVRRDVSGDIALLRLDDGERRERSAAVGVGHLAGALEKPRMEVEDVAGVRLASRRTVKCERHLTIGDCLLGEVVIDDEDVPAMMLGVRRVAKLVVVHEVLSDGGTRHGGDVLHWRRVGSGGGDDDRLVENAMQEQGLPDRGDRRGLLADGDVDADHVGLALVDDGVDGDGRLARLAVADDELALPAADGDHGVDCHETRLDRLADWLALHDAGSLELNRTTMRGVDGTEAVNGLAEGVDDAAEHGVTSGDVHDAASRAALVTLPDGVDITKEDGAYSVLVEVLGETVHASTGAAARELQEFASHGGTKASHAGDTVADLADHGRLLEIDHGSDGVELVAQGVHDFRRADSRLIGIGRAVCHCSSLPIKVDESVFLMLASCARTDAS